VTHRFRSPAELSYFPCFNNVFIGSGYDLWVEFLKAAVAVRLEISQQLPEVAETAYPISGPSLEPGSSRIRHKSPVRSHPMSISRCSFDDQITMICRDGVYGCESVGRLYKRYCNVPAGSLIGEFPLWLLIKFNKVHESIF
jgi:hypothetical protein